MKKTLLTLGLAALVATGQPVETSAFQRADFKGYTQALATNANTQARQWHKIQQGAPKGGMKRIVTQADAITEPTSYWGSLVTPAGEEWMYTMKYTYEATAEGFQTITSADITIYDANFNVYRTFTAEFSLGENETTINTVQVAPTLSRKFFNIDDSYEVMVFVHATTTDYTGHIYTQVYSMANGSLVTTLEGDNIGAYDTATDSWSENYTMVFMREKTIINEEEEDYQYLLYFDVYSKAGWSEGCKLEHTFEVDYKYIAGAGNYALPILMNTSNNRLYYALPHYEKEYFVSSWSEDITPDNHFIIDLYDNAFNLIKSTSIPMELEDGALFSFPGLGELMGNEDMSFDFFGETTKLPHYVVGVENYIASTDNFKTSLYVYDSDGNRLSTIVENTDDYLRMSPVDGQQEQFCFYTTADDGGYFTFIDIPSCQEVATIPLLLDRAYISTSIDRVMSGDSYKYVSSMLQGEVDEAGNVKHKIAWFGADGTFEKIDRINLGNKVTMAQVNIQGDALTPYIFNTDDKLEYMFLVKEQDPVTSRTTEYFRIYNDESEMLLNFGPDAETGEYLNSIFLTSKNNSAQRLVMAYYGNDQYRLHTISLPFSRFAGGDGTAETPYQISTAGDLMAMHSAPGACYEMINDIDFDNTPWTGNKCEFTGLFDGKGHTISNLNLTGQGIFWAIRDSGKLHDLNLDDVTVKATQSGGIIAGSVENGDKDKPAIYNVHICGANVTGNDDLVFGGIAGETAVYSSIDNCSVTDAHLDLGKNATVGGIVGSMGTSSKVSNALFDGWINAYTAGGIAGRTQTGDETITDCHAHAEISANAVAGGIIGASSRTAVSNCFVDGTIAAIGTKEAYSGGIVGDLKPSYNDETAHIMVIERCIVAAEVSVNEQAKEAVTHRIAGFTSGDELLVDWESTDPNVNWSDPSTYPYINGEPEKALRNNYYIGAAIDNDGEDTPDGKAISKDDLTDDFLAKHNWAMGTTWQSAGTALALTREDFSVSALPEAISISNNESDCIIVEFSMPSRYAHLLEVTNSDLSVATVAEISYSADGKTAICRLEYVGDGVCSITAANELHSASCVVTAQASSIAEVTLEKGTLKYDGKQIISADRDIKVYDAAGRLVAQGRGTLATGTLAKGVYIATDGTEAIKISK